MTLQGDEKYTPPSDIESAKLELLSRIREISPPPPEPDAGRQPKLYDRWMSTFERVNTPARERRPFTAAVPPPFPPTEPSPSSARKPESSAISPPDTRIRIQGIRFITSGNWSGASVEAHSGGEFRQVRGCWTVPWLDSPAGPPPPMDRRTKDGKTTYQCSTWIGLDGQRLYDNATLPQAGTIQELTVDSQGMKERRAWAWVQWWARNEKWTLPWISQSFPVMPGDRVVCVLTVEDSHKVLCTFVNEGTGAPEAGPPIVMAVEVDAPRRSDGSRYAISGANAEWVMERPAILNEDGSQPSGGIGEDELQNFPGYNTTTFDMCYAAGVSRTGNDVFERNLANAQFIRMYARRSEPSRTEYISMPTPISDTSFKVAYGGFW